MPAQPNDALTETVYAFIQTYMGQHGYAPTLREIAAGCYISYTTVVRYLDRLEWQGRIMREPGRARSIRVVVVEPDAHH